MSKQGKIGKKRLKSLRVRRRLGSTGTRTEPRPRLSVFRSGRNIYAQVIDDVKGHTLAAASSMDKEVRESLKGLKKTDAAGKIGELIAQRAKDAGVSKVAFDRGPYKYHGRVRALADAARSGGLEF